MTMAKLLPEQIAALAALANGIIPSDAIDDGAASVDAATRLAAKIEAGMNSGVYINGLDRAARLSAERFIKPVAELAVDDVEALVREIKATDPAFYKQLRLDVSAMYLSDPAVWTRIGFPGPSTATGGYPDFDQEQ
jgi:hypothetical protein